MSPRTHPVFQLPAPWAAGIILGLIPVVPMPGPTIYRGLLRVVQTPSGAQHAYKTRMNCLIRAAKAQGFSLWEDASPSIYCQHDPLGWIELVDCVDLRDANCPYSWKDHFNAGEQTCAPWGWVLQNPQLAEPSQREPATLPLAQQTLFAGA